MSEQDSAMERLQQAGLEGTVQQSDDSDFLSYDPADVAAAQAVQQSMDVEKEFASKELLDLLNRVERDVTPWVPTTVGESLFGTVIDMQWVENSSNDYDDYWMIVVETPSGRMLGFHGYHQIIAKNIAQKKESGELAKGSQIALSYRGEGRASHGRNAPKLYNMALISPV